MRANEFCYWLQGYFEICETQGLSTKLDGTAARCVDAHLALVAKVEPDHSNVFVAWLSEHMKRPSATGPDVAMIRRYLAAQFQHVIDPSYGGDREKLNQIHGFIIGGVGLNGEVCRC